MTLHPSLSDSASYQESDEVREEEWQHLIAKPSKRHCYAFGMAYFQKPKPDWPSTE